MANHRQQPAGEQRIGAGLSAEPDSAALLFCEQQQLDVGAWRLTSRTHTAAAGLQPNQQHQPRSFPEPAESDASVAAGKQAANHQRGRPQRWGHLLVLLFVHLDSTSDRPVLYPKCIQKANLDSSFY